MTKVRSKHIGEKSQILHHSFINDDVQEEDEVEISK